MTIAKSIHHIRTCILECWKLQMELGQAQNSFSALPDNHMYHQAQFNVAGFLETLHDEASIYCKPRMSRQPCAKYKLIPHCSATAAMPSFQQASTYLQQQWDLFYSGAVRSQLWHSAESCQHSKPKPNGCSHFLLIFITPAWALQHAKLVHT